MPSLNPARASRGRRLSRADLEAARGFWPDLGRNPSGRGHFSLALCPSSLTDTRYASLLFPRSEKKWLASLPIPLCRYTPGLVAEVVRAGASATDQSSREQSQCHSRDGMARSCPSVMSKSSGKKRDLPGRSAGAAHHRFVEHWPMSNLSMTP